MTQSDRFEDLLPDMTAKEAASTLGVSEKTVAKLAMQGRLKRRTREEETCYTTSSVYHMLVEDLMRGLTAKPETFPVS
jgi:predicted site-specific integrase-resolvase